MTKRKITFIVLLTILVGTLIILAIHGILDAVYDTRVGNVDTDTHQTIQKPYTPLETAKEAITEPMNTQPAGGYKLVQPSNATFQAQPIPVSQIETPKITINPSATPQPYQMKAPVVTYSGYTPCSAMLLCQ